jgi:hypothetical protein
MQRPTIDAYVHEIIAACAQDPSRLELITTNFQMLATALKRYDRAPRTFDMLLEDALGSAAPGPRPGLAPPPEASSEAVIDRIVEIIGWRPKLRDLVKIAKEVGSRLAILVGRDLKRNQGLLWQWFDQHWDAIRPILRDCADSVMAETATGRGAALGGE